MERPEGETSYGKVLERKEGRGVENLKGLLRNGLKDSRKKKYSRLKRITTERIVITSDGRMQENLKG